MINHKFFKILAKILKKEENGTKHKRKAMSFKQIKKILQGHQEDLSERGVRSLAIFGSIAKDEGKVGSDIDILVDFDSKQGMFVFVDLKHYLEDLLECEVDLVTKNALHPALKQRILREAKHVF